MKDLSFSFPILCMALKTKLEPFGTLSDKRHHLTYNPSNYTFGILETRRVGEVYSTNLIQ
jgi:hypothetical protein